MGGKPGRGFGILLEAKASCGSLARMSYRAALLATTVLSEPGFNWRPGIGDPTVAGWVTVALYVFATLAFRSVAIRLRERQPYAVSELRIWYSLFVLFAALGVNKQLDLQTALTELGRLVARDQGWYESRGAIQVLFVAGVGLVALIIGGGLLFWAATAPFSTWVALLGALLVVAFVVVRAASFHHVDSFIGQSVFGLRWNWVLEMGGISLAWFGAFLRARQLAHISRPPVRVVAVQQRVRK
jgi:hypothetical protein